MVVSIPAITVWQPWADLIAIGAKPWEFRGYCSPRHYRGHRIAIHAGMRPVKRVEIQDLLVQLYSDRWKMTALNRDLAIPLLEKVLMNPKGMVHGAVVCTATLGTPIRNQQLTDALGTSDLLNDSDRAEHTRWGWPLTDIRPLVPPAPALGSQGWWRFTIPQATEARQESAA